MLLEIGPDPKLSPLVTNLCSGHPLETVATLKRGEHDWEAMLETVARLYVAGTRIDWTALQGEQRMRPVRLPTHPFKRTRFWYEGASAAAAHTSGDDARHPLLGRRLRLPGSDEIRFQARFSRQAPQFLEDHQLFGVSLPPAASHLSMLAQAAATLSRTKSARAIQFTGLNLVRPLLLPEGTERDVQLIFRPAHSGWDLELVSADSREGGESADWTTHLMGQGFTPPVADRPVAATPWDLAAVRARCSHRVAGTDFYGRIWANQGGTGSSFRWIDSIWHGDREALCRAVCPAGIVDQAAYDLHPGIIEAACQVLHCCGEIETVEQIERGGVTYIPFSIDAFVLNDVRPTHAESWCHARLRELTEDNVVADLTILTSSGQVVASLDGFCLRQITRDAVLRASPITVGTEREQRHDRLPVSDAASTRGLPDLATMTRYLQQQCAEIVGDADTDVPTDAGFAAIGVDSLAAMRLANQLARDFGCKVSLRQILTCRGIDALAASIVNDRGGSSSSR
jgi:myxalamid-type polyketide synthase MxaB